MKLFENYLIQEHWNENIAAILTTYCRFHNLEISRKTIFENYCGYEKMAHFNEVNNFCTKWNIEFIHLNFAKEHLDEQFLPAFVLMEDYRTQLIMYVNKENVFYVDSELGWQERSKEDFFKKSMGHIIIVDHENYLKEATFTENELKDKSNSSKIKWEKPKIRELTLEQNFGKLIIPKNN